MKLKEQIQNISISECMSETLEYIADDYALNFYDWCIRNHSVYYHELSIWNKENYKYSSKELLEIFKKEKGL